jgi:hypothetical protein
MGLHEWVPFVLLIAVMVDSLVVPDVIENQLKALPNEIAHIARRNLENIALNDPSRMRVDVSGRFFVVEDPIPAVDEAAPKKTSAAAAAISAPSWNLSLTGRFFSFCSLALFELFSLIRGPTLAQPTELQESNLS